MKALNRSARSIDLSVGLSSVELAWLPWLHASYSNCSSFSKSRLLKASIKPSIFRTVHPLLTFLFFKCHRNTINSVSLFSNSIFSALYGSFDNQLLLVTIAWVVHLDKLKKEIPDGFKLSYENDNRQRSLTMIMERLLLAPSSQWRTRTAMTESSWIGPLRPQRLWRFATSLHLLAIVEHYHSNNSTRQTPTRLNR